MTTLSHIKTKSEHRFRHSISALKNTFPLSYAQPEAVVFVLLRGTPAEPLHSACWSATSTADKYMPLKVSCRCSYSISYQTLWDHRKSFIHFRQKKLWKYHLLSFLNSNYVISIFIYSFNIVLWSIKETLNLQKDSGGGCSGLARERPVLAVELKGENMV